MATWWWVFMRVVCSGEGAVLQGVFLVVLRLKLEGISDVSGG